MNWMKKGPELKLSELKVPDFLYDLFYDLKERHLLPLVAVLIVAIIGAPIYFKSSTESDPEPAATAGGATATASSVADGETLVVAHSEPGLRSYKQRLKKYRELDPFEQRVEEAPTGETEVPAEEGTTTTVAPAEATVVGEEAAGVSETPVESTPYSPGSFESGATESGSTVSEGGKTQTRYASDVIDVRIVTVPPHSTEQKRAKKAEPKAEVRRNLPELTMLPDRQTPAATYIGLSNDGKKALFVVSSDVVSLFGEGKCVIGSQTCQMLALEPGLPETFVYGPQERTYRIELLKINKTLSAKPHRATLGATEGKHHSGGGGGAAGTTGSEPAER
jgi:hypothetical protein